jgi:hypothetical protein
VSDPPKHAEAHEYANEASNINVTLLPEEPPNQSHGRADYPDDPQNLDQPDDRITHLVVAVSNEQHEPGAVPLHFLEH